MMVETILESSQDFGMLNGVLPQWKRELLQRRAARQRPALPPTPPPPPPPPPPLDDEELRYGPGHVKRLKSRYLSLAHRDPPRRRPSVLRRATSLEHLLDERPPPAPRSNQNVRPIRPVSVATPVATALIPRRDSVKRARSVDALSRLESREELQPPSPPPIAPRPAIVRSARPPRRPTPLLRETERPPPDVVRSTLRKFESAPPRKPAPAARVSAVLRGLEANQPRSSTPEPRGRSPSPASNDLSAIDDTEGTVFSVETKQVSQAALEGIARAGSTVRYSFEAPRVTSHLPRIGVTNPVLLSRVRQSTSPRRIGVIRPMPALTLERSMSAPAPHPEDIFVDKAVENCQSLLTSPTLSTPVTIAAVESEAVLSICLEKRDSPPSALVEPMVRSPPEEHSILEQIQTESPPMLPTNLHDVTPEPVVNNTVSTKVEAKKVEPLVNGYAKTEESTETKSRLTDSKIDGIFPRNGIKETKRQVNGTSEKSVMKEKSGEVRSESAPWTRSGSPGAVRKARGPPPATTSVVFNFSNRKEVPDYIENDGLILRRSRSQFKSGEPGIVVLRPEALVRRDSESDGEEVDGGPPSPCGVRFINDNVLINGRSSMPTKPNKDRIAKLKLQFDDSLTRTFEYPSETSMSEDSLPTNTHIASAALARYTPSKTLPDQFELGVTRQRIVETHVDTLPDTLADTSSDTSADTLSTDAPWSEARSHHTDLLF